MAAAVEDSFFFVSLSLLAAGGTTHRGCRTARRELSASKKHSEEEGRPHHLGAARGASQRTGADGSGQQEGRRGADFFSA